MLIRRISRHDQPGAVAGVDWSNPITQGLAFLAPIGPADGFRDLVSGVALTNNGLSTTAAAVNGVYPVFGTYATASFGGTLGGISGTMPITIAWTEETRAPATLYQTVLNWKPAGATYAFLILRQQTGGGYSFTAGPRTGAGGASFPSEGTSEDGRRRYVLRVAGGTDEGGGASTTLWRDGVQIARSGTNAYADQTAAAFEIGTYDGTQAPFVGLLGNLHIWRRLLTESEARAWSRNEFITREPQRIFVPMYSAGVSLPTLSLATYVSGSITSSGFRPRVTAS